MCLWHKAMSCTIPPQVCISRYYSSDIVGINTVMLLVHIGISITIVHTISTCV